MKRILSKCLTTVVIPDLPSIWDEIEMICFDMICKLSPYCSDVKVITV